MVFCSAFSSFVLNRKLERQTVEQVRAVSQVGQSVHSLVWQRGREAQERVVDPAVMFLFVRKTICNLVHGLLGSGVFPSDFDKRALFSALPHWHLCLLEWAAKMSLTTSVFSQLQGLHSVSPREHLTGWRTPPLPPPHLLVSADSFVAIVLRRCPCIRCLRSGSIRVSLSVLLGVSAVFVRSPSFFTLSSMSSLHVVSAESAVLVLPRTPVSDGGGSRVDGWGRATLRLPCYQSFMLCALLSSASGLSDPEVE